MWSSFPILTSRRKSAWVLIHLKRNQTNVQHELWISLERNRNKTAKKDLLDTGQVLLGSWQSAEVVPLAVH